MTPYISDSDFTLYVGDVRDVLAELPAESVHCVVTSPPYWGLRDYGTGQWDGGDPDCDHGDSYRERRQATRQSDVEGGTPGSLRDKPTTICKCGARRVDQQLGLEPTPDAYVANMVAVFREVRRVLRRDGTCWLNLGDSYASGEIGRHDGRVEGSGFGARHPGPRQQASLRSGLKPKDLVGIPWRVAFALQADGWYLRSDIIWSKPNPMPESVTDRPTKAHEYLFLLTRSPRYFYDADAIRESAAWERWGDQTNPKHEGGESAAGWIRPQSKEALRARSNKPGWSGNPNVHGEKGHPLPGAWTEAGGGRNKRSVWEIATEPYPDAHFATFPTALVEPCVKAGSPAAGTVLDPFMGSGTTALVARKLGRRSIGIELNPEYATLAATRLQQQSLLAEIA